VGLVLHAAKSEEGPGDFVEVGASKTRSRFDLRNWFADLF